MCETETHPTLKISEIALLYLYMKAWELQLLILFVVQPHVYLHMDARRTYPVFCLQDYTKVG